MSPLSILYLAGLFVLFVGERLLAGYDGWRLAADLAGVGLHAGAGFVG